MPDHDVIFPSASITSWTTLTRPATPDLGQEGFNTDLSAMEYWDGAAWSLSAGSSDGLPDMQTFFYAG